MRERLTMFTASSSRCRCRQKRITPSTMPRRWRSSLTRAEAAPGDYFATRRIWAGFTTAPSETSTQGPAMSAARGAIAQPLQKGPLASAR